MTLAVGTPVRVLDHWPQDPVHIRTPHYIRGKRGTIAAVLGTYANPEKIAFNRPAEPRALFHVLFDAGEVWDGGESGDLLVEVYEHWLEEDAS